MQGEIQLPDLGKNPPTAIRLYVWGYNPDQEGGVLLTKDGAKALMERFYAYGNALPINLNHNKLGPSYGQFKPQIKEDGLWCDPIQWTQLGIDAVGTGEYAYYSGELLLLDTTSEIVGLNGMAITNKPATNHQKPILKMIKEKSMDDQTMNPMKQLMQHMSMSMQTAQSALAGNVGMMSPDMKDYLEKCVKMVADMSTEGLSIMEKNGLAMGEGEPDGDEEGVKASKESEDGGGDDGGDTSDVSESKKMLKELQVKSYSAGLGKVKALQDNVISLQKSLKDTQKSELYTMVDKAILERKIAPTEKSKYFEEISKEKMKKDELIAYLQTRSSEPLAEKSYRFAEKMEPDALAAPVTKKPELPAEDKLALRRQFERMGLTWID